MCSEQFSQEIEQQVRPRLRLYQVVLLPPPPPFYKSFILFGACPCHKGT